MEGETRISKADAGLMVGVALAFDAANGLINVIPVAGQILSDCITVLAYACFWLWFTIKGVAFARDPKRAARFFGTAIIELIPILNVLPAITLGVFLTIATVKAEDVARGASRPKTQQPSDDMDSGSDEEAPITDDGGPAATPQGV